MFMSRQETAGQSNYIKVANKSFEKVAKFKYEGEANENRKNVFKFNLLNESGTQLYHFST
jgi:hypothetical protein